MRRKPVGFVPAAQRPGSFSLPWRTGRSVGALVLREMTTTYGRSFGGYLWALLEPIGSVLILTIVFSVGLRLRQPSLGISFPMFYATGMLIFMLYVRIQQKVATSITYSRSLLRYPAVRFFDAILARVLLNLVTHMAVMVLIFSSMILLFETRTIVDLRWILMATAMATAFGIGVGMVNAFLMPMFPIYASLFSIATTPLFLISGVIFLFDEMPNSAQDILWYNPLVHIIAMMRRGFYGQYEASFVSPLYVFGVSLLLAVVGYILISRYFRQIVDRSF
ncbi:ABC transporter permease [Neogemmobacter tilapiae]|uniref:Transport permease protein n=1 Tax=Neogemmobacter tilapiae TaxID=875041 RepID=A0A918WIX1_9RHOB|nr:ABC transporter permease [Gemmobacter tilapiae]GHC51835.1 transport permease protein [Gemmobacter tilapiae]